MQVHFRLDFTMEQTQSTNPDQTAPNVAFIENNMNPDQTAPKEQSDLGSLCF